jgi:hypothetical protein
MEELKMKRIAIVLLALCIAGFAFAEGFGMKAFVAGGMVEPGLIGTSAGSYTHNAVKTGFDVKLGARKPLGDFFELPSYLPLTAQVALGFQMNKAKGLIAGDLMAFTLNIDAIYRLDDIIDIPYVDVSPLLGIKYDAHIYKDRYVAHLLGLQLAAMVGYDLSDLLLEGLGVELVLGETFDFDISGNAKPFLASAYINLGVSYAFEF